MAFLQYDGTPASQMASTAASATKLQAQLTKYGLDMFIAGHESADLPAAV